MEIIDNINKLFGDSLKETAQPGSKLKIAASCFSIYAFESLPGQLFYSTQIPVCRWFLAKNKNADAKRGFRDLSEFENNLALAA
jgi:type I restriction-modification system DNA methylase subunit